MDLSAARYIRLRLQKIIFPNDKMAILDNAFKRKLFYSIKDVFVGGRCICNGHAKKCKQMSEDAVSVRTPTVTRVRPWQRSDIVDKYVRPDGASVRLAVSRVFSRPCRRFPRRVYFLRNIINAAPVVSRPNALPGTVCFCRNPVAIAFTTHTARRATNAHRCTTNVRGSRARCFANSVSVTVTPTSASTIRSWPKRNRAWTSTGHSRAAVFAPIAR